MEATSNRGDDEAAPAVSAPLRLGRRKRTRYDESSQFQKYTFGQLLELNALVRKRNSVLRSAHFEDCAPGGWLTGGPTCARLARHWQDELRRHHHHQTSDGQAAKRAQTPSLIRALRRTFGLSFVLIAASLFASDIVCEPLFFYFSIRLIEIIGELNDLVGGPTAAASDGRPNFGSNSSAAHTILGAPEADQQQQQRLAQLTFDLYVDAIVFLVAIVAYQLMTHPYAWLNHKMSLKMRVGLSRLVYAKALQISSPLSCSSVDGAPISTDQALSLISRDLEALEARFSELAWVLSGPAQCFVFTAIVSRRLDVWTAIVACLLNGAASLQRTIVNMRLRKYNRSASAVADRRMGLLSETLDAIRLIRMYAWTRPLEAKIGANRAEEIRQRRRHLTARAVDVAMFFISASAAAMLALLFGYYVRGLPFTQSMVSQLFMVTATYRRALSRNLGQGIQAWAQLSVVIERCQAYLLAVNKPVERDQTTGASRSNGTDTNTSTVHKPLPAGGVVSGGGVQPPQPAAICQLDEVSLVWPTQQAAATTSKRAATKLKRRPPGSETNDDDGHCLRSVSMDVQEGELIIVAGQVGSGKSSLLQIMLGELAPSSGSARIRPGTELAYASQKAWIFAGNVRENILLGRPFNLERYYQVIRACALIPDLCAFSDFDRTRIGERGVTLSGGQKARINLARALYQQAHLYLLDDPLSAVDAHVSTHIFNEALRGYLRGKTVILVTHQLQCLRQADKILYLDCQQTNSQNGASATTKTKTTTQTSFFGTYEELDASGLLGELLSSSQPDQPAGPAARGANKDRPLASATRAASQAIDPASPHHDRHDHESFVVDDRDWVLGRILSNRLDESVKPTTAVEMAVFNRAAAADNDEMSEITESRRKNRGRVRTSKAGRAIWFYMQNAGNPFELFAFIFINIVQRCIFLGLNIYLNFWAGYQVWTWHYDYNHGHEHDHEGGQEHNGHDGTLMLVGNKLTLAGKLDNDDQELSWLSWYIIQLDLAGALWGAGLIWLMLVLVALVRVVQFRTLTTRAGIIIHDKLISSLLWTKLSFFDRTAQGHLVNRLAADMSYMDTLLPNQLDQISVTGLSMAFVFIGTVMATPRLFLVVAVLAFVAYKFFRHLADLMELIKYLDGFRRADLYSHVGATIDGLATIRSAQQQQLFSDKFDHLSDRHSSIRFLSILVRRLIIGTVDWILIVFYVFLVVFTVNDALNGRGAYAFVGLNLVVQLTRIAQNTLLIFVEFYLSVQSLDRIREYATELDDEQVQLFSPYVESSRDLVAIQKRTKSAISAADGGKRRQGRRRPPVDWHADIVGLREAQFSLGTIEFSGVSLKFPLTNKLVLDNISFRIEAGSKIGVIGRTGAGKSSLVTALFHLYHFEGFIYIDGQDTKQLQLESLRRSLSIIPQDPCLFTGTIRHNLDPFNEHSDDELWHVLEMVQLKQLVQANMFGLGMPINKSGENISIGQRQLICLARAILTNNKIVVMDEATSNVDQETDSLIQTAIRDVFKQCTIITIAHRLSTVIDMDKLMILQNGRIVEFGAPLELLKSGSFLGDMIDSTGEQEAALLRGKITGLNNSLG
jgi:ABC-type multidrug transport system fused ATPase/permease subunit